MKKLLVVLLFISSFASAATLAPIQMLSTAGSTSGQAIVSTGPSTPAAWSNVTASGLVAQAANTVVANVTASSASPTAVAIPSCSTTTSALQYTSGTGFSCGAGFAALTGAAFTGPITVTNNSSSSITINGTGNSGGAQFLLQGNGATTPNKLIAALNGSFSIFNNAVTQQILALTDAGVMSTSGGISSTPISGSTGSFTTLAASSTVSGTGFSNYLASPPCIGCTTPGTVNASGGTLNGVSVGLTSPGSAQFSQLAMTGLLTPQSTTGIKGTTTNDSPAAGSVGETLSNSTTGTSMSTNTPANCTSKSLPGGNYLVFGQVTVLPSASPTQIVGSISTTSVTLGSTLTSLVASFTSGANEAFSVGPVPLQLASTTTVYLVGQAQFASGTTTCNGVINAIRIR